MRALGLGVGGVLLAATWALPAPAGMPAEAWRVAGVAALMAAWWVTEALPLPATALIPLVLLPLLDLASIGDTAAPYANPVIFLFLGGFMLAGALSRCGLHRRIALGIVAASGTSPAALVAGFMGATAFLSMWVSNTATVLMVLPIALSVLALEDGSRGPASGDPPAAAARTRGNEEPGAPAFAIALLLGVAYAANIGGMATLIGTPPNALLAGFMDETYGVRVGFVEWMVLGLPLVAVALPLAWALLTRGLVGARAPDTSLVRAARAGLGPVSRAEVIVGAITALTAGGWMARPLLARWVPGVSDAGIAIAGALSLFVVSEASRDREPLLAWEDVEALPWGVLILFGGGLSLASVIQGSGLAGWIGASFDAASGLPPLLVIGAVTAVIIYVTELTSNTATAATFLPVAAAVAIGIGIEPLQLAAAVALSASAAFMMPVATPPNAVIYGSGLVPIGRMVRAGFWLNLAFIGLITAAVRMLTPLVA
jgi:sodium-dependent dicarboxylate transporter 2/3/5